MTPKKPKTPPLKTNPKRQATDSLRGYVYQIWHSVNAWLDLADDEVLYLEGAEDFEIASGKTATATQVKDTQHRITLRSREVKDAINHYWELRANHPGFCVGFRFLTRSKISKEQGSPFGKGQAGLQLWSRCSGDETAILRISHFLQSDGGISEEIGKFLQMASPQQIYDRLIKPISWETESKEASFVEKSIRDKLASHGDRYNIPPSYSNDVVNSLLRVALIVATQKEKRELTRVRFLEIFEEKTTQRVPIQHLLRRPMPATIEEPFVTVPIEGSYNINTQSQSQIQSSIPPLYTDVAPRTALVENVRGTLQTKGFAVIDGGTGVGKTTIAKLTANALGGSWFWVNFTNGDQTQVLGLLQQLAVAVRNHSEQANIVLDDLNLQPNQLRTYEEALGILVYGVLEHGAKLLITSQHRCPGDFIRRLGVSPSEAIHVTNFDVADIVQLAIQLGCPVNQAEAWSKLVQLHTRGHPRLVHARLARLCKIGWKEDIKKTILQTPPDVLEELEEARQLLMDLPIDQREFLYRLSLMPGPFKRDLAVNIGEIEDSITHPGDIFSQLVGPWIDPVSDTYYGISPLLNNAAAQVWSGDKIKKLRAQIANTILRAGNLTKIEAQAVLINSIAGKNETALVAIIHALRSVPIEHWRQLSRDFSWLIFLNTNDGEELISGDFIGNQVFRSLQYRIAAEVEPETAPKILEIWERETESHSTQSTYLLARKNLMGQALMSLQVALPLQQMMRYLKELISLDDTDAIQQIYTNLPPQLEGHIRNKASDFSLFFETIVARRPFYASDLNDLFDALDQLEPQYRDKLLANFKNEITESLVWIDGVLLAETEREQPDWTRCLSVFDKVIEKSITWGYPSIAWSASRVKAVISDEQLDDPNRALEDLQAIETRVGLTPMIKATQAGIYLRRDQFRAALDIYERILPSWKSSSEFDFGPLDACRRAGICAAKLNEWEKSASFFVEGAAKAREINDTKKYISLYVDAGFAQFKTGDISNCLELLSVALQEFEKIPRDDTDIGYFTLKKLLGYSYAWLAQPTNTTELVEPPPGFCSNPDRNPDILEYPNYAIQYGWLHLAQLEYRLDLGVEIFQQAKCLKDRHLFPFLDLSLSILEVQYDFKCKTFGNLPHRMDQLAHAFVTTMKHEKSGKGIEETGSYTVEIADLDKFASVENITALLVTALLVQISKGADTSEIIALWRIKMSELRVKDNFSNSLDLIESMKFGGKNNAATEMRTKEANVENRLAAALAIVCKFNVSPEDLFYSHLLLTTFISNSQNVWKWEESLFIDIAELLSSQWLQKIKFQALLKTPTITVPQIKEACKSSETGKKKIGWILLAIYPAVSVRISPEDLKLIRSWIE